MNPKMNWRTIKIAHKCWVVGVEGIQKVQNTFNRFGNQLTDKNFKNKNHEESHFSHCWELGSIGQGHDGCVYYICF